MFRLPLNKRHSSDGQQTPAKGVQHEGSSSSSSAFASAVCLLLFLLL
jgi:hypothetical protein